MKNSVIVLMMLILSPVTQAGDHEVEAHHTPVGVQIFDDGRAVLLVAGSQTNVPLWQAYIQAHNDRDFEEIAAMNAEDFEAIVPTGERIIRSAAQAEFLKAWIAESNPVWRVMNVVANDGENAEWKIEEWLSTGQMISSTDAGGNPMAEYHSIDVKPEAGRIKQVYVAAMQVPHE